MYGTAPVVTAGSQAGATGTPLDATLPSTGGADGGPISTASDASEDTTVLAPDAALHADNRLWTRFPPSNYTFTKCTWFSKDEGFCQDAPGLVGGSIFVHLYKTINGGKAWTLLCGMDTEMPDTKATINVYVLSQLDFWFVAGYGNIGSIGHSADGGKHWTSLTSDITSLLAPSTGDAGVSSVPVWQLVTYEGRTWILPQGGNLAYSQDGGLSWRKFAAPAEFAASPKRSLDASQNSLLLQSVASDGSLTLHRWNGSAFLPTEATMPASSAGSHAGTWSRSWPTVAGTFFADRGPLPSWASPFAAYATIDGGKTLSKLLPNASDNSVVGLSDGIAFMAAGLVTSYVSGIFTDGAGGRFLEIRLTQDTGKTWTTVHSEPSYPGDGSYISLSVDAERNIHAMHFVASTDGIGPQVIYDAHYILP
jgi:photosystem II stability/assembly factor-like uncharacterized protein